MLVQVEPEGDRALFRILLRFPDHDFVAAETSGSQKAAIARIGMTVQQHAARGPASAVILQRRSNHASRPTDAGIGAGGTPWEIVEHWGSAVVDRIRGQCASTARVASPCPAVLDPRPPAPNKPQATGRNTGPLHQEPVPSPTAVPAGAAGQQPAGGRTARDLRRVVGATGRPGHRWETGVSVALAAGAWLLLAAALTGGRLSALAGSEGLSGSAAVATELPFSPPDATANAELPPEVACTLGIDG